MKKKSIAFIIMLLAGTVIAFTCLLNKIPLTTSFLYIAASLLFFYILGLIINGIITKMNTEAEARAKELKKMQKEAEEKAKEEAEARAEEKENTPEEEETPAEEQSEA